MRTKTPVTVTIDRELDLRLQAMADREHLPFSQAVNTALKAWALSIDAASAKAVTE